MFEAANQLTFFAEDGVTYQVLVRPDLPGRPAQWATIGPGLTPIVMGVGCVSKR